MLSAANYSLAINHCILLYYSKYVFHKNHMYLFIFLVNRVTIIKYV